ncbi:MAG: lysophospholipid acyltransferase family protein [Hyphomicrobiaceae bacterium]
MAAKPEAPKLHVSRLRDLQFRAEYLVLRAIIGLVRLLPLDTAAQISANGWALLAPRIARRRHQRAFENLAIAFPEMTQAEKARIVDAHWRHLGRMMVETMQIDRILSEPARIEIANRHVFERYRDKLGAIVGMTLHMGNWELAIYPVTLAGARPAAVFRTVNNPYFDAYLRGQRARLFPGGLFGRGRVEGDHGDDQKTARMLAAYVRDGGRLGIVCDLYDRTGIEVPFFGKPAKTQAIGAIIARRTGARVWIGRCLRIGHTSRFRIEMEELKVPRSANASADVHAIVAAMQARFEDWVRDAPEQWMWSNRRWK